MAVLEYLENGGSAKDLYAGMVDLGVSQKTAYTNVNSWRHTNFEQPIAYSKRTKREAPSTRYENSTLSRLKKLLGF